MTTDPTAAADTTPTAPAPKKQLSRVGLIISVVLLGCCGFLGLSMLMGGGDEPEVQPVAAPVDGATIEATEEAEATDTVEPTETDEPTATEEPATEPTATEEPTAEPTAVPPTAVPPTAAPAFAYDPPCQDTVNCADFTSRGTDPQAWWNARKSAECPNPGHLDGDNDNSVCEEGEGGRAAAPPPPAQSSGCVSFNSASFEELLRIINVDDKIANHIIELRAQRPFNGWDDLVDRVNGIGKNNVKEIQDQGLGCF